MNTNNSTETSGIETLKAQIRAANSKNERLDGGGDNRPPVYRDGDTWVYRASTVGGLCDRALWLARMETEPSPTPATLTTAYIESANNEQLAILTFVDQYRITVDRRQDRFELPVPGYDNVIVRGHIDGIGHTETTGETGLVEVKCVRAEDWNSRSCDMYPSWRPQIQLGMKGTGCRHAWIVWGRKVEGVVDRVSYTTVEYQPRVVAAVFNKIRRVEQAARSGGHIECVDEQWGCPYWTLHTGRGDTTPEIDDNKLAALATRIADRSAEIKRAEQQVKQLRGELLDELAKRNLKSAVIVGGGARLKTTVVEPKRKTLNEDRLREKLTEFGAELDDFIETKTGKPYVKVEQVREKEGQ